MMKEKLKETLRKAQEDFLKLEGHEEYECYVTTRFFLDKSRKVSLTLVSEARKEGKIILLSEVETIGDLIKDRDEIEKFIKESSKEYEEQLKFMIPQYTKMWYGISDHSSAEEKLNVTIQAMSDFIEKGKDFECLLHGLGLCIRA